MYGHSHLRGCFNSLLGRCGLAGADIWVSSCGAAAKGWFSYAEAAPTAGWTSGLLLRRPSLKSRSSGNAAGALFFTPALGLHILSR